MKNIDFVIGLQLGDESKAKVSYKLTEKYRYKNVIKFNGGPNAGHTFYVNEKKYVAHQLTAGAFFPFSNVIIGPGCVVNEEKLFEEIKLFEEFDVKDRVFVCDKAHLITKGHIEDDSNEGNSSKIGTTKQGIGPCYRDKYNRTGIEVRESFQYNWEMLFGLEELYPETRYVFEGDILFEGSQGMRLDIILGNYPYVTSSHIHPAFALASLGIPFNSKDILYRVFGVAKMYETYSGSGENIVYAEENDAEIIQKVGQELGATTGRKRHVGYMNLSKLIHSINSTGTNVLILNKGDVLQDCNIFKIIEDDRIRKFTNYFDMSSYIEETIKKCSIQEIEIFFSETKDGCDLNF